jgi:hypothetical protein
MGPNASSISPHRNRLSKTGEHRRALSDKAASVDLTRRYPLNADYPLEAAVDAIVGGDLETVARLLADDPELIRGRSVR